MTFVRVTCRHTDGHGPPSCESLTHGPVFEAKLSQILSTHRQASVAQPSSIGPLLAAEVFLSGLMLSSILRKVIRLKFLRRVCKKLFKLANIIGRKTQIPDLSTDQYSHDKYAYNYKRPEDSNFFKRWSNHFHLASCNTSLQGETGIHTFSHTFNFYYIPIPFTLCGGLSSKSGNFDECRVGLAPTEISSKLPLPSPTYSVTYIKPSSDSQEPRQPPVGAPPPQGYPPKDVYPPPAPGYPVEAYPYQQPQYAGPPPSQQQKETGFLEGCLAALCCCCLLDACF
ncbi:hypothetical protein V6N13_052664 [Hibiscus sabdariffa]